MGIADADTAGKAGALALGKLEAGTAPVVTVSTVGASIAADARGATLPPPPFMYETA